MLKTQSLVTTNPLITIITVVYNAEAFLEETIKSVISQKAANIKYIIVDGGSTDGTLNIIQKYKYAIDYLISEPDKGLYDAMNKGWKIANDDSFVMFLGAGDKIITLPAIDNLRKNKVIFGNVKFDNKNTFNGKADFRLKLGNTIHHQALLIHKSLHSPPPFDTSFKIYADFDFNQRLLKHEVPFFYDESFISYALPGGCSSNFNHNESLKVVRKNFGWLYSIIAIIYYNGQKLKEILKNILYKTRGRKSQDQDVVVH